MIDAITRSPLTRAIGLALVQFLWQGAVLGLIVALVLAALRRASANARYLVACVGLIAMALSPLSTVIAVTSQPRPVSFERHDAPLTDTLTPATPARAARVVEVTPSSASAWTGWQARLDPLLPSIALLWSAIVFALTLRLVDGWIVVDRVKRSATKAVGEVLRTATLRMADELGIRRRLRINESGGVDVPTVVGWLRPAILIPASALAQLSPSQIEAIVAHELAHIRRHDYLVNGLQNLVETLLFYHPAVWWLSARARIEREHCCDDLAVGVCGNRVSYARALATLEETRQQTIAFELTATGGALLARVQRVLGSRAAPRQRPAAALVLCAVIVISAALLGGRMEGAVTEAKAPESPLATSPVPTALAQTPIAAERSPQKEVARSDVQSPGSETPAPDVNDVGGSTDRALTEQLKAAEAHLAELRTRLAPTTTELLEANLRIVQLRKKIESLAASPAGQTLTGSESARPQVNFDDHRQQVQEQIARLRELAEERKRLQDQLGVAGRVSESVTVTDDSVRAATSRLEAELAAVRSALTALQQQMPALVQGSRGASPPSAAAVFPVGGLIREPRKTKDVPPIYPPTALAAKVQGVVIIDIVVDRDGNVTSPVIRRSVPMLNEAALAAVRQWKYERTAINGVPIGVAMEVTLNFTVPGVAPRPSSRGATPAPSPAPLPDGAVRVGGTVKAPRKIVDVPPIYPAEARAAKMQGVVILDAMIDRDGNVADAKVIRSVPMLDQAALDAVRQWKYEPARVDGQPTAVAMAVTVNFTIGAGADPGPVTSAPDTRLLQPALGSGLPSDTSVQVPATCAVTKPSNPAFEPPYPSREPFAETRWAGSARLWTLAPAGGVWHGVGARADGKMHKTFWWRPSYDPIADPHPALTVTARRLDAPSEPAIVWTDATNASSSDLGGATMLVGVTLPQPGCWQIEGRVQSDAVTYTVWAVE